MGKAAEVEVVTITIVEVITSIGIMIKIEEEAITANVEGTTREEITVEVEEETVVITRPVTKDLEIIRTYRFFYSVSISICLTFDWNLLLMLLSAQ